MPVDLHVAVIGGGPAGAAAALTLRRRPDIRVTLIEASRYDTPRAGEALSPGTRGLLDYLGVWDNVKSSSRGLETWANEAAWGSDQLGSLDYINTIDGPGWGLDRRWFDQMLAQSAAAKGANVLTGQSVTSLHPDGNDNGDSDSDSDGWRIALNDRTLHADYVIDAAGRSARYAARFGAERKVHDRMVGVCATLQPRNGIPQRQVVRIEAVRDGWWYAAPLPDNRISVVFMSDADIVHAHRYNDPQVWAASLATTQHIAPLLDLAAPLAAPTVFPAYSARCRSTHSRIIAAGDAAACHDPLSSSGIPNALASGIQAARVAADAWFGKGALRAAYESALSADFDTYLTTRTRYYAQERRWPDAPFWRRRAATITLAPDSVLHAAGARNTPHVPNWIAARMRTFAASPISAATLVTYVRTLEPSLPDNRIILAAQDLLTPG